ncbi:MAG: hypothetical protein ABJ370_07440 [Paracoccaceae bacterium]
MGTRLLLPDDIQAARMPSYIDMPIAQGFHISAETGRCCRSRRFEETAVISGSGHA